MNRLETFRKRLVGRDPLYGLFTRLADPDAFEALAASRLDFIILDVEHGSLGRAEINRIVGVSRSFDLPVLVRLPDDSPAGLHHAMAVGAAGVLVPHIASADQATRLVRFLRGDAIERAYAGMGRLSDFRRRSWHDFRDEMLDRFCVIGQIDETTGAAHVDEIAATQGLDAVFVGSLSLALSMAASGAACVELDQEIERVCAVCQHHARPVGLHLSPGSGPERWLAQGANLFVVGNDMNLLRLGADQAVAGYQSTPSAGK